MYGKASNAPDTPSLGARHGTILYGEGHISILPLLLLKLMRLQEKQFSKHMVDIGSLAVICMS
jgi:hypothetical protein